MGSGSGFVITREQIFAYIETLPGTGRDMPFAMDFDTTVLRHARSGKWFGIVLKAPLGRVGLSGDGETDVINLKCDPLLAYGLTQAHAGVVPAYHMNKRHWITVVLDSDVRMDMLETLIAASFELTALKRMLF